MGVACRVSTSMQGRAIILRSIFLAGASFTTLFFLPATDQYDELQDLQRLFLWEGTLTAHDGQKRYTVAADLLMMPTSQGGIGAIDLPVEFALQAAKKIYSWATLPPFKSQRMSEAGQLNRRKTTTRRSKGSIGAKARVFVAPQLTPTTTITSVRDIWRLGTKFLERYTHDTLVDKLSRAPLQYLYDHCHVE